MIQHLVIWRFAALLSSALSVFPFCSRGIIGWNDDQQTCDTQEVTGWNDGQHECDALHSRGPNDLVGGTPTHLNDLLPMISVTSDHHHLLKARSKSQPRICCGWASSLLWDAFCLPMGQTFRADDHLFTTGGGGVFFYSPAVCSG